MVPLTVTVTDTAGNYRTGLTETDFVVFEDGVAQTLSFFATDFRSSRCRVHHRHERQHAKRSAPLQASGARIGSPAA
jgi:hypothetical protein